MPDNTNTSDESNIKLDGTQTADSVCTTADSADICTQYVAGTVENLRNHPTMFDVRDFGAIGDGVTDDRVAIQAAIDHVASLGGGTVLIPPLTFLLGSDSTDANRYQSLLTPKNNVSIIGFGLKSVLKVAAGTNARWAGTNGPNVIATRLMLSNCTFKDFVIDWNGANNLLTSSDTRRNNAAIMAYLGGLNILCENLIIKDVPGNQCIFFPNLSNIDSGQGFITVQNCKFENVGEGLAGNYNYDHSSVYLNGKDCKIINNRFISPTKVRGTVFEIHGSYSEAYGNYAENYENAFYIATNYESITDIVVHHNTFRNCNNGNVWSGTVHPIGKIEIHNNWFYFVPGSTAVFANEAPKAVCEELNIHDNQYTGQYMGKDFRCMQVNLTKTFIFRNNTVDNFSGRALTFGYGDLGDGYICHNLIISHNIFNNVVESTAYSTNVIFPGGGTTAKIRRIECESNSFFRDTAINVYALDLSSNIDNGRIKDNYIDPNYVLQMNINPVSNKVTVDHVSETDPATVYCQKGSEWRNKLTNIIFTKLSENSIDWRKSGFGTAPPTTGAWKLGDIYENTAPVAGGYSGWRCTVGGTPGTWQPFGQLRNLPAGYDTTKLPDSFDVGEVTSIVNGDANLPSTTYNQGILKTIKLNSDTGYRKFIVQFFYPANNDATTLADIYFRKANSTTNAWSTWKKVTGV